MDTKTKETARVVIIGSGAAGIAAATRLLQFGFKNVQILEAENRIGGRINSVPFGDNVIDLGAQWCHGEVNNLVYEQVKDRNLLHATGDALQAMRFVRSNGEVVSYEAAKAIKDDFQSSVYFGSNGAETFNMCLRSLTTIRREDRKMAEELLENLIKMQCSYTAADDLAEESNRYRTEFHKCGGEFMLNWRDKGYKTFLRLLMNASADKPEDMGILNGRVQLNTRVKHIYWGESTGVILRSSDEQKFIANHVICTMSLGVLKKTHQKLFVPGLPDEKIRAIIEGLRMGTVNKIYLEYNKPVPLPTDWAGIHFLWMESDLAQLRCSNVSWLEGVFSFHRVLHQPRLLQGWVVGQHARKMETLSEKDVLDGLEWLLQKFILSDLPPPQKLMRSTWDSNPSFYGSFSSPMDVLETAATDLEAPLPYDIWQPRLLFAGEATSRTHFSTVHGAVETGWREAERINEYYDSLMK